jgi:hypothetical protein
MIIRITMRCLHCGSTYTVSQYQSRSADEASTILSSCPNCPLDVSRLDLDFVIPAPHIHVKRFNRTIPNRVILSPSDTTKDNWVSLDIGDYDDMDNVIFEPAKCMNTLNAEGTLLRWYSSGIWQNHCVLETYNQKIGPSVALMQLEISHVIVSPDDLYTSFEFCKLDTEFWECFLIRKDKTLSIWCHIDSCDADTIHDTIHWLYLRYSKLKSLKNYIQTSILASVSNLSARAYDAHPSSITQNEYRYAPKADGERIWLTRIGIVWVLTRRLKDHEIKAWYIDESIDIMSATGYGPIIDYEFLLGPKDIFIDVLMDEHGKVSSERRNLLNIELKMQELYTMFPILKRIDIRSFRDTIDEAQRDCESVTYPTDGVVGITHNTVDMIKIKSIKSMELRVSEHTILVSDDGTAICEFDNEHGYADGTIVEVGFQVIDKKINIVHFFIRPDKLKANSSTAIYDIIASGSSKLSSDTIRTAIWRYSNSIRSDIYERAHSIKSDKRLILDIGTGDGQSIDNYIKDDSTSHIFVEPDESKCMNLRRRLRLRNIYTDPGSISSVMPQLKTGKLKYHIMNCKLQDIFDNEGVTRELLSQLRCAISCFSSQYITKQIFRFISSSVPFMGCCYMYDDIPIGGSIVDEAGLIMRRLDDELAMVQWGKDTPYFEPAIERYDLPPYGLHVEMATNIVPFQAQRGTEHLKSVCDHIFILLS